MHSFSRCLHRCRGRKEVGSIKNQDSERKEVKRRFQLWIKPSTLDLADKLYKENNCESRSEFIEKAVLFYGGYLSSQNAKGYLPSVITSTVKGIVAEATNRICKMMFKQTVELAMLMNIIAASQDIDKGTLDRLRGECVKEVKRSNGYFSLEDAIEWQKG